MDQKIAKDLRAMWGNKPCRHSILADENINGKETGSKICITCGREIYGRHVDNSSHIAE